MDEYIILAIVNISVDKLHENIFVFSSFIFCVLILLLFYIHVLLLSIFIPVF